MIRKLMAGAAAVAVAAGVYLLALEAARSTRIQAEGDRNSAGSGEPQIVLRGVEILEGRTDGPVYRLLSDEASYAVASGRISASAVVLALKEHGGEIVVTASRATWDMNEGLIDLPEGASAENGTGWSAAAPRAGIDLRNQVITAGEAKLAGPGVTVAGDNLAWRWNDGTLTLQSTKSSILPGAVKSRERNG